MDVILNFLNSNAFSIILFVFLVIILILYIRSTLHLKKLREDYSKFMHKLGNGSDLDQMMQSYIKMVEQTREQNEEIMNYCKRLNGELNGCMQKIGLVRYNAFKDTGSDLSFTLALLDKYNNGVVLNGIFARDSSNIYAKPVNGGESSYILSSEEKEAIQKAVESK